MITRCDHGYFYVLGCQRVRALFSACFSPAHLSSTPAWAPLRGLPVCREGFSLYDITVRLFENVPFGDKKNLTRIVCCCIFIVETISIKE